MRGSDFAELRAFAAVVERASFARAADHLGFSPSALSQTIRQLETRLGVRLLNRTTRSVAPTSAGARLYERIVPVIRELDAAVAEAVEATGRTAGTLRINTLSMAADRLIAPRLGRFHRAYPQVVLDIVIEGALQGLGILYAYDDERIDDLIARGQLKRVLAEWSLTLPGLFLYYSNRRLPQPALRAFIDCLLDRDAI